MTAAAPSPRRDEAQVASTDPSASVWVAANAGTGKTKVLTDRILRLLLAGVKPSRILCLTFTKAAATEMRLRLAGQLGNWATLDDKALAGALAGLTDAAPDRALIERAQGLFAQVLDAPGGLPILTIHSFCQSLLKRFPIELGVAPHFQVIEEHHAQELLAKAQQDLLADLGQTRADKALVAALKEVSGLIAESEFDEALRQMVGQRQRIAAWIARHKGLDGLIAALKETLQVGHEDAGQLRHRACADAAFDAVALRRALPLLATGTATNVAAGETMAQFREAADIEERLAGFERWRAVFLTGTGAIRASLVAKKLTEAHPWPAEGMAVEAARLVALAEAEAAIRLWRATAAMLRLARAVTARYDADKRRQARLDFDDQIEAARKLLARSGFAPWVLYKLDGGIDHVLIDEAQDTNPAQWEVVLRLTEEFHAGLGAVERPRTLFVVGDPKQSIFSFQRADPREFARMRDAIEQRITQANEKFFSKDLVISYRSTQPVLDAVDAVFAQPLARDGLFSDQIVHKVSDHRQGDGGLVEIWPPVQAAESAAVAAWETPDAITTSRSPEFRLARAIADHIARAIKGGERLEATGRPIQPGDILILVRRRNELVAHLVRELKTNGIEVAGVDRMVLTEQLAVMDLTALGEFLLQPDDDLSLAGILKSPLIGLDEDQLMELAMGRSGTLWAALRARAHEPAYTQAHAYLAELLAKVDFVGPYALYGEILGPRQGRHRLQARLGHDAADPIDEFLALTLAYERNATPSLQGFLHWFHAGANEVKRELDQARGQVRIMTVHGAKGLQAPIVYLPDTCQKPDINRDRLLWPDDGDYLLWAARAELLGAAGKAVRDQVKVRAEQEYRRLLYVAMTRAADRLYVCGYWNARKPADDSWYKLIEAGLADERQQFAFDNSGQIGSEGWSGTGWRFEKKQRTAPKQLAIAPAEESQALPAWAQSAAPSEPNPPKPLAPSRNAADAKAELAEPAAFSPLSPEDRSRFKRGLLIHRLLQSLPDLPAEGRAAAAQRFLAQPIHGLDPAEQAEMAAETLSVLGDAKFAALFAAGSKAEVALAGRIEGRSGPVIVSGQVDRLCLLPDRVLIVDYKTNRPPPEHVAQVPALYLRQMAAYRALLAQIHPGKAIACLLLWTNVPRLMELPADLLDLHSP